MPIKVTPEGKRVVNLIKAVRMVSFLLPGDHVKMIGEGPAIYIGAIEEGDLQFEYFQMHAFRLCDGQVVILEVPSLNRSLGKYLF